jgi:hypothetical protein
MKAVLPHETALDRLLKLGLLVARFGKMDVPGWWNKTMNTGRSEGDG